MNRSTRRLLASISFTILVAAILALMAGEARAQCPGTELTSGLLLPLGITQSNQHNLLVAESGTPASNTGRISIVDLAGNRRTLLSGLPSGINDVNEVSGPSGVSMRGRTLYVLIGIGDSVLAGDLPRTQKANPSPSSPLFSSVLAIHLSASVEMSTEGFTLTPADRQALAEGQELTLSNGRGDRIDIELVANFADYTPEPLPTYPINVRGSNPFDLVVVDNELYVTDGGQNSVSRVDINSGAISVLATFGTIPNPLPIGPPAVEAVPTGIAYFDGQLLVALLRGVPFPPGTSVIEQVDPATGAHAPFITGLKTAIDVLPVTAGGDTNYLVLQHASIGPFFGSPGLLLRFDTPASAAAVVTGCLARPTSTALDEMTDTLYIAEYLTGRIVATSVAP
jgi:hypothetical protein